MIVNYNYQNIYTLLFLSNGIYRMLWYISTLTLKQNTSITLENQNMNGRGGLISHLEWVSTLLFGGFKFTFEGVGLRPHPSLLAILSDE